MDRFCKNCNKTLFLMRNIKDFFENLQFLINSYFPLTIIYKFDFHLIFLKGDFSIKIKCVVRECAVVITYGTYVKVE